MTVPQLLQLYAPLLGLLGVSFWLGVLTQRVKGLESDCKDLQNDADASGTIRDRLTRIETHVEALLEDAKSMKRGMDGVQRQLGNLMGMKGQGVAELPGAHP